MDLTVIAEPMVSLLGLIRDGHESKKENDESHSSTLLKTTWKISIYHLAFTYMSKKVFLPWLTRGVSKRVSSVAVLWSQVLINIDM